MEIIEEHAWDVTKWFASGQKEVVDREKFLKEHRVFNEKMWKRKAS